MQRRRLTAGFARLTLGALCLTGLALAQGALAAVPDPDRAVARLKAYLQIDTTNPPGNEQRAVDFLAAIFEAEGIPYETAQSAPGRGNIWARIEGGDAPALMLLNHTDVVPADASAWDEPPFSGAERDGFIYGRGALDTKGLAILQLEAFLALHRSGVRPDRDVIFAATADEEAGGFFGAGWLVETQPQLLENLGYVLNEGGGGQRMDSGNLYSVEVTQKIPLWLRLTARAEPGHGSVPRVLTAPDSLVRALDRIARNRFPPRVIPEVWTYMQSVADLQEPQFAPYFRDPDSLVSDPDAMLRLHLEDPRAVARLRDTCAITRMAASLKINVIPATAWAELDCRLLPDADPDAFIEQLAVLIDDPDIQINRLMGFTAASSSTDTPLYRTIEAVLREAYPQARIVPGVAAGFTDSHFFRDLDIVAYGFSPLAMPAGDYGVHGHNERVSVAAFREAVLLYDAVLRAFVTP